MMCIYDKIFPKQNTNTTTSRSYIQRTVTDSTLLYGTEREGWWTSLNLQLQPSFSTYLYFLCTPKVHAPGFNCNFLSMVNQNIEQGRSPPYLPLFLPKTFAECIFYIKFLECSRVGTYRSNTVIVERKSYIKFRCMSK